MTLLNLKEQRRIVEIIEYLVETQNKNNTVGELMAKFGITFDEYRMCCELGKPAITQGNIKSRMKAIQKNNRTLRQDVKALYELADGQDGPLAEAVRRAYKAHVAYEHTAIYGKMDDNACGN